MLSVVLASSNAPSIYREKKDWQRIYESQLTEGIPPPRELAAETDDVMNDHLARIIKAHQTLREKLSVAKPDALVIIGYDDGIMFSQVQVPQFCTYTGQELTGSAAIDALGETPSDSKVTLNCAPDLAWEIHRELIDREFDMNYMSVQNPQGRPEWGASSAFMRPGGGWLKGLDIPVVPLLINCMVEPTPSGGRCLDFGTALGQILDALPQKFAVLAVGGLSHDPNGPRAGWVDERLDNFVMDRAVRRGQAQRLRQMFDLESDAIQGGTGQIRTWMAAAAAAESVKAKGVIVDYIPSYHAVTGLGFASWTVSP
jgi:Catalytic LigB subunit of aromatic ring-opening dioxygenase